MKANAIHNLRLQLLAESVDANLGILRGCTVGKANVEALGKTIWLDKSGAITRDEKLSVKELPVFTDAKFLDTLMAAAAIETSRKKLKVREDHDDRIGARAGFAAAFRRVSDAAGDRVAADVHLYASYRNRGVVLETADKNPEGIGLSIDFVPEYEIVGERALMRVSKLLAVDIVDEGAITPGGLFLSAGVDTDANKGAPPAQQTEPTSKMAEPTLTDLMSQLGALTKTFSECAVAMSKLATPPTPPAADPKAAEAAAEMRANVEKIALAVTAQGDALKALTADNLRLKKTAQALGVRVLPDPKDRATLASGSAEEIERIGAGDAGKKDYLALVAEHATTAKCSKSDAHLHVQRNNQEAYREHLRAKGIYDPAKAKTPAAVAA